MFNDDGIVTPIPSHDAFPIAEGLGAKPFDTPLAKLDELRSWRSICLKDELDDDR
jgi:hypothetical protein